MYKKEDVYKNGLRFYKGDELATNIWVTKYCLRDGKKYMELKPEDSYMRVAKEIARVDGLYNENYWYELLIDMTILPAGSPLASIGNPYNMSSLGNCFVVGNEGKGIDSYAGILKTDAMLAYIMKRRGGVGHDISHLRPKGAAIHNSAVESTGIIPWMKRFSNTTREVAQGGRRGALMISIDVSHPEIENFIDVKSDLKEVTGANISIKFYDDFMDAVIEDIPYELTFESEYETITKTVNAREIWEKFIKQTWSTAEPGALFWDTIIKESLPDCYADLGFKSTSTNPCGEIILSNNGECLLTSTNLTKFVVNPYTAEAFIDWEGLSNVAYATQRFMDNVVELELQRIAGIIKLIDDKSHDNKELFRDEILLWHNVYKNLKDGRRTGASAIGIGDMLAMLNMKYDSDEAINVAEEVYKSFAVNNFICSVDLAQERGAFPIFDKEREKDNPYLKRILESLPENEAKRYHEFGRRNIASLTIPPSGSIAGLAQITSGIEPVFMNDYIRKRKLPDTATEFISQDENGDKWEEYNVLHHGLINWYSITNNTSKEDSRRLLESMSIELLEAEVESSPYYKATSQEISPLQKVKLQGRIQKWVDHSISNTINLPKTVTLEEVSEIYMEAWKQGLKGVTIYRDGSRDGVLVSKSDSKKNNEDIIQREEDELLEAQSLVKSTHMGAPKSFFNKSGTTLRRPNKVYVDIHYPTIKKNKWVVLVGVMEDEPYEVFTFKQSSSKLTKESSGFLYKDGKGKYRLEAGNKTIDNVIDLMNDDTDEELEIVTQLVSALLRHVDLDIVVRTLHKPGFITSSSKVIARILKKYIHEDRFDKQEIGNLCPSCGSHEVVKQNGCESCLQCGWSKCT